MFKSAGLLSSCVVADSSILTDSRMVQWTTCWHLELSLVSPVASVPLGLASLQLSSSKFLTNLLDSSPSLA